MQQEFKKTSKTQDLVDHSSQPQSVLNIHLIRNYKSILAATPLYIWKPLSLDVDIVALRKGAVLPIQKNTLMWILHIQQTLINLLQVQFCLIGHAEKLKQCLCVTWTQLSLAHSACKESWSLWQWQQCWAFQQQKRIWNKNSCWKIQDHLDANPDIRNGAQFKHLTWWSANQSKTSSMVVPTALFETPLRMPTTHQQIPSFIPSSSPFLQFGVPTIGLQCSQEKAIQTNKSGKVVCGIWLVECLLLTHPKFESLMWRSMTTIHDANSLPKLMWAGKIVGHMCLHVWTHHLMWCTCSIDWIVAHVLGWTSIVSLTGKTLQPLWQTRHPLHRLGLWQWKSRIWPVISSLFDESCAYLSVMVAVSSTNKAPQEKGEMNLCWWYTSRAKHRDKASVWVSARADGALTLHSSLKTWNGNLLLDWASIGCCCWRTPQVLTPGADTMGKTYGEQINTATNRTKKTYHLSGGQDCNQVFTAKHKKIQPTTFKETKGSAGSTWSSHSLEVHTNTRRSPCNARVIHCVRFPDSTTQVSFRTRSLTPSGSPYSVFQCSSVKHGVQDTCSKGPEEAGHSTGWLPVSLNPTFSYPKL